MSKDYEEYKPPLHISHIPAFIDDKKYFIRPVPKEPFPETFYVLDHNYSHIDILYFYAFTGEWIFKKEQDIAEQLGVAIILWYE